MEAELFFQTYLAASGREQTCTPYEVFAFGGDKMDANELLALVLAGKKRATASCAYAYEAEGERPPRVGDLSVVTEADGRPRCIIETTAVTRAPFNEITEQQALREGENTDLAGWREAHRRFFKKEGSALGYAFTETLPVLFEDFRVVFGDAANDGEKG